MSLHARSASLFLLSGSLLPVCLPISISALVLRHFPSISVAHSLPLFSTRVLSLHLSLVLSLSFSLSPSLSPSLALALYLSAAPALSSRSVCPSRAMSLCLSPSPSVYACLSCPLSPFPPRSFSPSSPFSICLPRLCLMEKISEEFPWIFPLHLSVILNVSEAHCHWPGSTYLGRAWSRRCLQNRIHGHSWTAGLALRLRRPPERGRWERTWRCWA